jgi:hypothetical protein
VSLWFNPFCFCVGFIGGSFLASVLLWMTMRILRLGATLAHREPYRSERRMTAAIHYGTAWVLPAAIGAQLALLIPFASYGQNVGWPACPPAIAIRVIAGVLGGLTLFLWWFWLVRLGSTAPAKTRGRVVSFFALGLPVIVVGAGGLWWGILRYFLPAVLQSWRLAF